MNLPIEFTNRMRELLAGEYEDFLASYNDSPLIGLRTNTLKLKPEELAALLPGVQEPVGWCEDGFYCASDMRPGKNPYYHAGLYYIQEPSAMAPASIMDISPGQRVLDLCAAPGGKSTHLAVRLGGQGVLISNDVSPSRARALLKNIELFGVANCVITTETPARLAQRFAGYFDRILVDAPCSGEGMFRKDPESRGSWSAHKPNACQVLQRECLYYAAQMLKPGGRLMYSTCTFAPEENELMIAGFLSDNPGFTGVEIAHAKYGIDPGLYGEPYTARIWPHKHKGEGHFLAYLQKSGESSDDLSALGASVERVDKHPITLELYQDFCRRYLTSSPASELEIHGRSLFMYPPGLPSLNGVRLSRCGLYLGDILTKRFEPSQAFAMTLRQGDVRHSIDFAIGDSLYRYLRGESFEVDTADGWNLVTVTGFPLGWAKAANGRIKNKYLKGWLMN